MKLKFAKIGAISFAVLAALAYIWILIASYFDSEYSYYLMGLAMPITLFIARLDKIFNPRAYPFPLWCDSVWFIALIGFLQWVIIGFILGLLVDVGVYSKKRVK